LRKLPQERAPEKDDFLILQQKQMLEVKVEVRGL
jgi:hypothetical protein